jgi:serine/threonine-protein kinase
VADEDETVAGSGSPRPSGAARRSERPPATEPTPSPSSLGDPRESAALGATAGARTAVRHAAQHGEHVGDLRRARPVLLFAAIVWPLFFVIDLAHAYARDAWSDLPVLALLRVLPEPWFVFALVRVQRRPTISARELTVLLYGTIYLLVATLTLEACVTGGLESSFAESILAVLAGTTIVPRPASKHGWPMAIAAAIYPVGMVIGALVYPPMHGQLSEMRAIYPFVAHTSLVVTTAAIVVIASNRLFHLRRSIAEVRSIGRYELERRIGKGGMGEVWAAWHRGLERKVALKILRLGEQTDPLAVARFEREVRLSSGLTHPNTVRVFDSGTTEDGLLYYAMELLDGSSLGELVKREGPLPPARAVHLVTQAARALAEAHDAGIVHRDVKPENLFVTSAGGESDFVKVLDFGIARAASEAQHQLTETGAVTGTPATMSPEVITGHEATPASDVYGLGATLYIALTGRAPFKGEVPASTLLSHLHDAPVPPSERTSGAVPADVDAIVLRALAKKPDDRFADGRALAEALAASSVAGTWRPAPAKEKAAPSGARGADGSEGSESDTRVEVPRRTG